MAQEGWICPRCGKVNAPWMTQCTCTNKPMTVTCNATTTNCTCTDNTKFVTTATENNDTNHNQMIFS